jgi:hypothetical protein
MWANQLNNILGKHALVLTMEEDDYRCLFLAIIVKGTPRPGTWIPLGPVETQSKEYFDAKYA